jgi:hypothetical protein
VAMWTEVITTSNGVSGKVLVNKVTKFRVHTTRGIPYKNTESIWFLTFILLMWNIWWAANNASTTNVYYLVTYIWQRWKEPLSLSLSLSLHNVSTLNQSWKTSYVISVCTHLLAYTDMTQDVFHDWFSVETLCRERERERERDKETPFSVAKCRSPNITH